MRTDRCRPLGLEQCTAMALKAAAALIEERESARFKILESRQSRNNALEKSSGQERRRKQENTLRSGSLAFRDGSLAR